MGLIKSALLLGGGIYAVKKITKSHEKKHEKQRNNNNNQDMYMYGDGHLGQNQQYHQPQQRPGQGYNYNGARDGSYHAQDYDYNRSRGQSPQPAWEHPPQSQYGYAGNGRDDFPPAYVGQDEKKRMK